MKHDHELMTEEQLEALLVQWATAEIEPPAEFHKKTMERLRAEQQNTHIKEKKNNVVSFLAGRKKWMSAVAAAVLVLCCIPVVQAQLGQDGTDSAEGVLPNQVQLAVGDGVQTSDDKETAGTVQPEEKDAAPAETQQTQPETRAKNNVNAAKSSAEGDAPSQQTVTAQEPVAQAEPQSTTEKDITYAERIAEPTQEAQIPAIASYQLDNGDAPLMAEEPQQGGKKVREVTERLQQVQMEIEKYETAIEDLTKSIEELQKQIAEYDEKLKQGAENTVLQEERKRLETELDLQKKELETLKESIEKLKNEMK